MKFYFIILIFACSVLTVSAQESKKYFGDESVFCDTVKGNQVSKLPIKEQNRLNVRFSAGTMFSNYYGTGFLSTYAAPEVNYKMNNRFSFSVGTMMTSTTVPSLMFSDSGQSNFMDNKMLSYYVFAKGEYMINDKLRVRGTTAFDVGPTQNTNRLAFGAVGFDYKIGEDSFISAEFVINNTSRYDPMFNQGQFGAYDNRGIRPYGGSMFSQDPFTQW